MKEAAEAGRSAEGERADIRLLLVDDDSDFLAATAPALGRRGIEVTAVTNGHRALRLLETEEFEVAVIDLCMPEMGGDELFQKLRQRHPGMPVIILTGHGTPGQVGEFSRYGIFHYLTKPCEVDRLAAAIHRSVAIGWRRWMRRLRRSQLGH